MSWKICYEGAYYSWYLNIRNINDYLLVLTSQLPNKYYIYIHRKASSPCHNLAQATNMNNCSWFFHIGCSCYAVTKSNNPVHLQCCSITYSCCMHHYRSHNNWFITQYLGAELAVYCIPCKNITKTAYSSMGNIFM